MISSVASSLSGLNAASFRLANSANNVANLNSTRQMVNGEEVQKAYVPKDVVQSSIEPLGGTKATLKERTPAVTETYAPDNSSADERGVVALPNVSLEEEAVEQTFATYSFKGSLKALQAQEEMLGTVLDMVA